MAMPDVIDAALEPMVEIGSVNDGIVLHRGKVFAQDAKLGISGPGEARLNWMPDPQVVVELKRPAAEFVFLNIMESHIEFDIAIDPAIECGSAALVAYRASSKDARAKFLVSGEFGPGESRGSRRIRFCIANMVELQGALNVKRKLGNSTEFWRRLAVLRPGVELVIDPAPRQRETNGRLREVGGFGITHVAELVLDEPLRSKNEFSDQMGIVYVLLSLMRGAECGPVLEHCLDADNEVQMRNWVAPRVARWNTYSSSWIPRHKFVDLSGLFENIAAKWSDRNTKDSLVHAVWWYGQANCREGGLEGSIIMAQAALELMSWTVLVSDREILSEQGFAKLEAHDKIRLLLAVFGASDSIPGHFDEIRAFGDSFNAGDGPGVVTLVRNRLVHPTSKKQKQLQAVDGLARHQALQLCLNYLELSILGWLGYSGLYADRLAPDSLDEIKQVPWVHNA